MSPRADSPPDRSPDSGHPDGGLSDEENEVVGALLAFSRVITALATRELGDDVTLPQFRTLVVLVGRGPQRVGDLAQELSVTSSTAVRMCNRLAGKGLVAREERPDDRRAAWITLTPSGRTLVGEVMRRRRAALAAMVAELSLTRPLAFAATINALVEEAGEVSDARWWRLWNGAVP